MLFDDYCLSPDEEDMSSDEHDNSGGYYMSPDEWHIPSIKSISSSEDAPLHQVYSAPLDDLRGQTIDLTPYFNDERFRFISCTSFVDKHTLSLYETESLPHDRYNAISYVWLGLEALAAELESDGSFRVYCGEGRDGTPREDGGPISMRVLRCACYYSLERNIDLLWLDRLGIKQTSKEDKAWQIIRMFDVYRVCQQCLVLPGGLQRLASVYEQTLWTERAWTFQEVLAGGVDKVVVFAQDPPAMRLPGVFYHTLTEGAGECCDLSSLVDVSLHLHMESRADAPSDGSQRRLPVLLGPAQKDLEHLRNTVCLELGGMRDPSLIFLTAQLILHAIAKRDSSRPIDMVLSIIGLLGVEKHFAARTPKFRGSQRLAATLALVEAVFRTHVSFDHSPKRVACTSLDVPLWASLERRTSQAEDSPPPTLEQLAQIFDNDDNVEEGLTETYGWRAAPLDQRDAEPEDVDSAYRSLGKRARNVAKRIPLDVQAKVYREKQTARIVDEEEGSIELRPNLDLMPQEPGKLEREVPVIFGWCLKLETSHYMRVFRFGLTGDVTNADS